MKTERKMFISFILNLLFTIVEIIGALITNSVALLSDSIHDIGDSVSIGISLLLEKKSKQKPDFKYTYGYYRFSLLGGLIASIILVVGSTIIIFEAVNRLLNPEIINAHALIWFAVVGLVVNGVAALNLIKGKSLNERVISLHLLEDVLGWLVILVTAIFIRIYQIDYLDTVLSILFTLFILFQVFKNLKKIMEIFLEKAPNEPSIAEVKRVLVDNDAVIDVHHVHLWSLEGNIPIATLHAVVKTDLSTGDINVIQKKMHEKLARIGIAHATIQVEFIGMDCSYNDCEDLYEEAGKSNKGGHHHH